MIDVGDFQPLSRGPYGLRQKAGQWLMECPNGDVVPAGADKAEAVELLNEMYRHYVVTSGMRVYFIGEHAAVGKPVKIGFSKNPRRRLADMQTGCHVVLRIFATVAGDVEVELAYHARFAGQRLHGEWFTIDAEILAEIARLSPVSPGGVAL